MERKLLLVCLLAFALGSCNETKPTADQEMIKRMQEKIDNTETPTPQFKHDLPDFFFNQKWLRSPNEDEKRGGEVYRPESFKNLQPMRFRPTFIFHGDKTCQYMSLEPNDAHKMKDANWAYNTNKQFRVFSRTDGKNREVHYDWTIKQVTKNILIVESSKGQRDR